MSKIFIQTNDERFKEIIAKMRQNNSDISEEIVKAVLLAWAESLPQETDYIPD